MTYTKRGRVEGSGQKEDKRDISKWKRINKNMKKWRGIRRRELVRGIGKEVGEEGVQSGVEEN